MLYSSISDLPLEVQEVLMSEDDAQKNEQLNADFRLYRGQFVFLLDLIVGTILGKFEVLDLPTRIAKMPDADRVDVRALSLRIALDKLWPLQDFLKKVDVLINRLGGRVPARIPLPSPEAVSEAEEAAESESPEIVQGAAKDILVHYKAFSDLYLTQKPIRDSEDRLKAPTLNNWLQDYLHTVGAEGTGSLKRSKYLSKSANALALNGPEKQNVLNFLMSYEEQMPMYWQVAETQFLLIDSEMPQEQKTAVQQKKSTEQMSELVARYRAVQEKYSAIFADKKNGLELEINGNTGKIADIVWDALGLGDTDRCLAAIDLLIDHHWLLETLKTDHRFQGIVGRSIGVRYGVEAKNTWNGDLTSSVMLATFWKLVLVEKLGIDETTAAILADLYRKKMDQKISPMYLDLKSGAFQFREIAYKDRVLNFA